MLSLRLSALTIGLLSCTALALPIKREVPQEHSHEPILTSVRASLNINNPLQIVDPVFALLGDAAAAQGAGQVTDLSCLQQAVADQAFTNAKAANDIEGMTNALIFRALERNTGKVGLASALCTQTAVNVEIQAISQHQDPASDNAAATNKAIALELAVQIASIGGNPVDAIKSGTFAPGDLNDATAKGNTCDDANDPNGCIFTLNLLVADVTEDEINVAVASAGVGGGSGATPTDSDNSASCQATATVTVTVPAAAASATPTAAASAGNLQKFTGALGGVSPPAVTAGGRGFVTNGADFLNLAAAVGRSCDVQHNQCANKANSGGGFSVGDCDQQNNACRAAN
ncbi:hypothetical protein NLI96_g4902 [Meripilus lineatus]|uniref:Cell wall mannoprotein n=1 Tax=Meripilus lineatus TaxID=2056292 RepID=A0AAD5YEE1_9APHY|nr:hypothetical protein NLI96_g4902 [Physisporinus lineatus]